MLPAIIAGLAQVVPMVAKLLGGETAGKAASAIVNIAEAVTGKKGDDAVAAIKQDPNLALEFEKAVMAQETDILKLRLDDVADARRRDVEIRKIGYSNWRADFLAVGALIGLIVLIWTLIFVAIPQGPARDVLLMLSGALVAIVKDVYQFEFGSSRGSKDKDLIKK